MARFKGKPKKKWKTLEEKFSLTSKDGVPSTRVWKIKKVSEFTVEIKVRFIRGDGGADIQIDTGEGLYNFTIPKDKYWEVHRFCFFEGPQVKTGKQPKVILTCQSIQKRRSYDNYGVDPDITEMEFEYVKFFNGIKY